MFSLIIIHDKASVNDAWNPAQQGQDQAQEKTQDSTRQEDGDWWENDAEKITQCFHGSG
jgi:hypothetical protein